MLNIMTKLKGKGTCLKKKSKLIKKVELESLRKQAN